MLIYAQQAWFPFDKVLKADLVDSSVIIFLMHAETDKLQNLSCEVFTAIFIK